MHYASIHNGTIVLLSYVPETIVSRAPIIVDGLGLNEAVGLLRASGLFVSVADPDRASWSRIILNNRQNGEFIPSRDLVEFSLRSVVIRKNSLDN